MKEVGLCFPRRGGFSGESFLCDSEVAVDHPHRHHTHAQAATMKSKLDYIVQNMDNVTALAHVSWVANRWFMVTLALMLTVAS